jgi:asparagine synthase (glutamine-hydrolysing)
MPGIVGFVSDMPLSAAEPLLKQMVESISHEPFYEKGTFIDESLGLYVGWAARRESFCESMPIRNEMGDVVLIFSGEEFPEANIRAKLRERGHEVSSERASYLVHLYEEDPNFPQSLNGIFQGIISDRRQGRMVLFNDRYGMQPVYYHESQNAFYFAAEAKAILAACPHLRTPSAQGVGEFIACSCVLENRTIFKDISVLPAGAAWVLRRGGLERRAMYFDPSNWEEQAPLDPESYYEALRFSLSRNLERYFAGPDRVGIALTGGMDTRVILALHRPDSGTVPCYTFGGMYRECQDVKLARKVAEVCGQTHQVIEVGDEFLREFPQYAERSVYVAEGGVDVYRAADLYVSEKARAIAPTKIVGTYGSEIVRHAVMFKPMAPPAGLFAPDFLGSVQQANETYAAIRRVHPVTFAAFRQSPWYHHGVLALEQSKLTVRSPYLDNEFVRTVFRSPEVNDMDVRLRLIADGSPQLRRIRSDRGLGGDFGRARSMISRNWLEFTFKAEYAYDYGMPQSVAKIDNLLSPLHLERLFLGRHKYLHYRVWYRNSLAAYVREILLDSRTLSRPYIDRKKLERIVQGHVKGDHNYTTAIHKMLTLELLQRLFFDRERASA